MLYLDIYHKLSIFIIAYVCIKIRFKVIAAKILNG